MGKYTSANEASKPANPSAGNRTLYPKGDGWYELDSLGNESKLLTTAVLSNFGKNYQGLVSDAEVSTTSEIYIVGNELKLTTPVLPLGDYHIQWSFEIGDGSGEFKVTDSIAGVLAESDRATPVQYRAKDQNTSFTTLIGISGIHDIILNYRTETGGGQATFIRRRRLSIWRVN